MKIRTELVPELTVAKYRRMQEVIDFNPPYQREGGVWQVETRSRLIDSILNGLDLPKLYFERATNRRLNPHGLTYQYAVLDGKQRLEAVSDFLAGDLRLPEDFWFFEDKSVAAAGMSLGELEDRYPGLARRFLDFELPVVSVTTDSGDLIEEMFQRLNASSALNAAERRNALAGPTRTAANSLAEHPLLISCSPIKSARYKYRELGAKFLVIEHQLETKHRIVDTKAGTLYDLFVATRGDSPTLESTAMESYHSLAVETLDRMLPAFVENDPLLASIGTVVVYYIAFRIPAFSYAGVRSKLEQFEELRRDASRMGEDDADYVRPANARLREYNVFVQSTNDGRALERRAGILSAFLAGHTSGDPLVGLDTLADGDLPEHEDAGESE